MPHLDRPCLAEYGSSKEENRWQIRYRHGDVCLAPDPHLLGLAKSILGAEKVRTVVEGDLHDLGLPEETEFGFTEVADPMEIWVRGEQAADAIDLLKDIRMDNV